MMISDWVSDKNFLTSLMTTSMLYVTRTPWHTLRSSCTRMSITLCPQHKLLVDGQGLSLSKRPSDAWDANLVGCRIMGSRPNNLFYHNFLRVELRHPFFSVWGMIIWARVIFPRVSKIRQSFSLCVDRLSSLNLFGDLGTHQRRGEGQGQQQQQQQQKEFLVLPLLLLLLLELAGSGYDLVGGGGT